LDEITKSLEELHALLLEEEDLDSTLRVVAEIADKAVPGCDCAGITLVEKDVVLSTACTDELCARIDRDQYITGEGPCVDAIRNNQIMRLANAAADGRWPKFGPLAERHGIESVLGLPLEVNGGVLGALNLYSRRENAFIDTDVDVCTLLATHAAVVLANAKSFEVSARKVEQLAQALESRGVIERAKGILMEREKCSAEEAFQMLVRASQTLNRKLRTVAEDVVDDAEGADPSAQAGSGEL
jgi:GAF domain-containing protein